MSDDEDFDEFPSICVNSSLHGSSGFSMPRADELASERARAAATERQLLRLRDEHALASGPATGTALAQGVSALTHSDSSGSEGEAALAAAVDALRVLAAPGAGAGSGAAGAGLLAALAARLPRPAPFLQAYADALAAAPPHARPRLTHEVLQAAAEMVAEAGAGALADEEALGMAAWLCALAAAPPPAASARPARRLLLRTLHLLIDDVATDEQVEAVWGALEVSCGDAAVALELSDALRGGGVRGERLARRLAAGALAALAGADGSACGSQSSLKEATGALAGAWRRLPAARRYLALQLLARAEGEEGAVAAALEALAQAPPGQRTQSTDELKVLVATTKLQVLFHVKR